MYGNNRGMDYSSQLGGNSSLPYNMDLGFGTSGSDSYGASNFSSFQSGNGRSGGNDFYTGGPNGGDFHNGPGKSMGGNFGGTGGQRGGNRGGNRGGGIGRGMGRGAMGGNVGGVGRGAARGSARGGLSGRGASTAVGSGGIQKASGGVGNVAAMDKEESGYLQDHAGHFPDEYWCKICNAKTTGPNNYRQHMSGIRHQQNLKNIEAGEEPSKTGPQTPRKRKLEAEGLTPSKKRLADMIAGSDDAFIGVDYVTEIMREGTDPEYECEICDCRTLQGNILFHLIGFRHRMAFIKKHKPDIAETMEAQAKAEEEAEAAAAETVAAEGAPEATDEEGKGDKRKRPLKGLREKVKDYIPEVAAEFPMKPPKVKVVKDMFPPVAKKPALTAFASRGGRGGAGSFTRGRGGAGSFTGGRGGAGSFTGGRGGAGSFTGGRGGAGSFTGSRSGAARFAGDRGGSGTFPGGGAGAGSFGGGHGGASSLDGGRSGSSNFSGGRGGSTGFGGGRGGLSGFAGGLGGSSSFSGGRAGSSSFSGGRAGSSSFSGGLSGPSSFEGDSFGTGGGYGRGSRSGMMGSDSLGSDFGSMGGRGRGLGQYPDTSDLGGGYDLPPRRETSTVKVELDNYLMDTLKSDSLVSDAFILREFERRFGSTRRPRGDTYDDLDVGPPQRDSLPQNPQSSFSSYDNPGEFTSTQPKREPLLPEPPNTSENPYNFNQGPSLPPLSSKVKKEPDSSPSVQQMFANLPQNPQSSFSSYGNPGEFTSTQPKREPLLPEPPNTSENPYNFNQGPSLPPLSSKSNSMIANEADAKLAKQVTETLTKALQSYESKIGESYFPEPGRRYGEMLPPPQRPPFDRSVGYSRL